MAPLSVAQRIGAEMRHVAPRGRDAVAPAVVAGARVTPRDQRADAPDAPDLRGSPPTARQSQCQDHREPDTAPCTHQQETGDAPADRVLDRAAARTANADGEVGERPVTARSHRVRGADQVRGCGRTAASYGHGR